MSDLQNSFVRIDAVREVLKSFDIDVLKGMTWGDTYESVNFPEGYEKPPKEEFEAKLQELIDAQPLKELRQERNRRLAEVDWVTLKAYSTGTPVSEECVTYMQTLRDLPSTTEDPANPVWPVQPSP